MPDHQPIAHKLTSRQPASAPASISFSFLTEHFLCGHPIGSALYLANYHLVLDDLKVRAMNRCFLCLIRQYYLGFYRLHLWT
ncbi:hypothetical protein PS928_03654 [Pseudomonas fluorescens]|uniref:Uncharacterized protein n=1 Tax=Pseudomonas fluorescens TaxID=294 RepID=A0A5E7UH84_PSEFL|nr:hypothetical protein PS928_03654 [Pseudomonas fluorescens]